MRALWSGEFVDHHGRHYTVENARLYTLPGRTAAGVRVGVRAEGGRARRRASATGSSRRRRTPR